MAIKIIEQEKINPDFVIQKTGAKKIITQIDTKNNPMSLFYLRNFLHSKLKSTGGRPSFDNSSGKRKKITFIENDWEKLQTIANQYKKEGIKASPSQIAAVLLHKELDTIE